MSQDETAAFGTEIDLTASVKYFALLKFINVWFICAALNFLSSLVGNLLGLQGQWNWAALASDFLNALAFGAAAIPAWRNVSVLNSLYQRWTLPSLWFLSGCMAIECGLYYLALDTNQGRNDAIVLVGTLVVMAAMLVFALVAIALTVLIRRRMIAAVPISFASLLKPGTPTALKPLHPRRRKPAMGIALAVTGFALLVGWNSVGVDFIMEHEWLKGSATALAAVPYVVFLYARSYLEPVGEEVLMEDGRAPILLLRSYADQQYVNQSLAQFSFVDYSLDARLAIHFRALGPFITVGSPDKEELMIGPARLTLSRDEWKLQIRDWMRRAQLIVLMIGVTEAVRWELGQLIEMGLTSKLVVGFPELHSRFLSKQKHMRSRRANAQARLEVLQASLQATMWAPALQRIADPLTLRALVFHANGSVTKLTSRSRSRGSHHLAILLGEHLARRNPTPPRTPTKSHVPNAVDIDLSG